MKRQNSEKKSMQQDETIFRWNVKFCDYESNFLDKNSRLRGKLSHFEATSQFLRTKFEIKRKMSKFWDQSKILG